MGKKGQAKEEARGEGEQQGAKEGRRHRRGGTGAELQGKMHGAGMDRTGWGGKKRPGARKGGEGGGKEDRGQAEAEAEEAQGREEQGPPAQRKSKQGEEAGRAGDKIGGGGSEPGSGEAGGKNYRYASKPLILFLQVIAEYLQKFDPKSDGAKRDWVAIYDECANVLYQEIDYTKEAANAEQFAKNFKNLNYVKVPSIFWDYTTPQVLTMEYVPGIKINKIKALDQLGIDRKRLGRYAVESYLEQILSHGFFHADPHPGNIAVDDVNGGRLIFYDFGMMGSISSNIREGLLETFYGVYEKDPDKVLQAMIQMGVLVPTGDMTAVRRTAQFFLNSFEERLAAQRREREMATAELGFKKPLTKEEKLMKKKERLAAIGEDLLAIAADQPFRFPATFTFVVRAFSVLDGIGKGLDPRFDITEIAKPYALELLKFREAGVEVAVKDFRKRWDRQSRAFYNLFRQAERVEKLAEVIQRLEQGDLKLRVRALESERAFHRVATVQKTLGNAIAAGSLINLATILYINSIRMPATIAYICCAFFGNRVKNRFQSYESPQQMNLLTIHHHIVAPTGQDLESFFRQKYYTAKLDPQGNGLAFLILRAVTSLLVWLLIHAHVASHSLAPHRQLQGLDEGKLMRKRGDLGRRVGTEDSDFPFDWLVAMEEEEAEPWGTVAETTNRR
ncbi:Protein ACTIVITY OF BC1 COMPLEX KINASE 8, chloroplastic, partial [Cucurbita argyrosperma subsp. sororia]